MSAWRQCVSILRGSVSVWRQCVSMEEVCQYAERQCVSMLRGSVSAC